MSHEAAIAAAGGRFLGEAHGTVWFTDPETQSTLAMPASEITVDTIAMTLLRSRRSFRQEQFRLLIEGLQDYAVLMLDRSGAIVSWNTGAERIYGYSPQEIIGRPVTDLYFPSDGGMVRNALEQTIREGRFEAEMWKRRKDGSAIWGDVVITSLRDEADQVRGYSYVCRDITRRHIEQQRQEARLCAIRVLTEGVEPDQVIPAFLACVCAHLGWDSAEFWRQLNHSASVSLRAVHCPADEADQPAGRMQEFNKLPIEQVFPESVATGTHPIVVQHNGKEYILGHACFSGEAVETALVIPLRNQSATFAWVLFGHRHRREPTQEEVDVVEDLTQLLHRYLQQERAEAQLRRLTRQVQQQADLLDRVLNASPDFICLVDREGRHTYVNSKAAAILGFEPAFMIGKSLGELDFPEDLLAPLEQARKRVIDTGQSQQGETSLPTAHGNRDFEYIMNPVWSPEGSVESVVISARDITERKRIEERLQVLVEQLPAIVWTTDESLRITSSLGAGLRPLGLKPDELKGQVLADVSCGHALKAAILEAHQKALRGQRAAYRDAWKQRLFNVWVQPLRRLDESIRGTIGLALDITEKIQAEAPDIRNALESAPQLVQPDLAGDHLVLLRKYLGIASTLLADLAAQFSGADEEQRRQTALAMIDTIHSISRELDHLAGPASSMRTDAA